MRLAILITNHMHQYDLTVDELIGLTEHVATNHIPDLFSDQQYVANWMYLNLPFSLTGCDRIAAELIELKGQL